jgi:hypothetical protein
LFKEEQERGEKRGSGLNLKEDMFFRGFFSFCAFQKAGKAHCSLKDKDHSFIGVELDVGGKAVGACI